MLHDLECNHLSLAWIEHIKQADSFFILIMNLSVSSYACTIMLYT